MSGASRVIATSPASRVIATSSASRVIATSSASRVIATPSASRVIAIVDLQTVLAADLAFDLMLERALEQGVGAVMLRAKDVEPRVAATINWRRLAARVHESASHLLVHESVYGLSGRPLISELNQHWSGATLWRQAEAGSDVSQPRADGSRFGVSAHSLAELEQAERLGASWAFLSPFMPTASKPGYSPTLGLTGMTALCQQTSVPVFALAGVNHETVKGLGATGVAGVAVMGMLTQRRAAEEFQRLFQRMEDEPWSRQTPW